jgi:spermidine/putrescine transport system permease protein
VTTIADAAAPDEAHRARLRPGALTMPAALGLLLFFAAPLGTFFLYSFLSNSLYEVARPFTFDAYHDALTTDVNRTLGENSLIVGLCAAGATVVIGLPVAYWLRFTAGRLQVLVLFLITATLFASYLARIFAWQSVLGGNGLLNSGLRRLGLIDHPLGFLLYNRFAVTLALVHIFLPYVVLVLYAGFRPISPALVEAAQDLGANAFTRWRRVILPLIAAPATSAFLLVFVLSASDYVTPQFVGGKDGALLGVRIQAALTGVGNWPLGAALSFLMLGAFLVCYLVAALALRLLRLDRIRFVS